MLQHMINGKTQFHPKSILTVMFMHTQVCKQTKLIIKIEMEIIVTASAKTILRGSKLWSLLIVGLCTWVIKYNT